MNYFCIFARLNLLKDEIVFFLSDGSLYLGSLRLNDEIYVNDNENVSKYAKKSFSRARVNVYTFAV